MTRILPFPLLSASLLVLWLLLNESISPGHLILGSVVALGGGWIAGALEPANVRIRNPGAMARLLAVVLVEVVRSNIAVVAIILRPQAARHTGLVRIPLELRNEYGLAVLACIITATPGTLWVGFDDVSGELTIHVLDLVDDAEWINTIKGRYERLLLEIFA